MMAAVSGDSWLPHIAPHITLLGEYARMVGRESDFALGKGARGAGAKTEREVVSLYQTWNCAKL